MRPTCRGRRKLDLRSMTTTWPSKGSRKDEGSRDIMIHGPETRGIGVDSPGVAVTSAIREVALTNSRACSNLPPPFRSESIISFPKNGRVIPHSGDEKRFQGP